MYINYYKKNYFILFLHSISMSEKNISFNDKKMKTIYIKTKAIYDK